MADGERTGVRLPRDDTLIMPHEPPLIRACVPCLWVLAQALGWISESMAVKHFLEAAYRGDLPAVERHLEVIINERTDSCLQHRPSPLSLVWRIGGEVRRVLDLRGARVSEIGPGDHNRWLVS
jgi:hypothetical protein